MFHTARCLLDADSSTSASAAKGFAHKTDRLEPIPEAHSIVYSYFKRSLVEKTFQKIQKFNLVNRLEWCMCVCACVAGLTVDTRVSLVNVVRCHV
jgi:hypothetical protein